MADVFISYSHSDRELARRVASVLVAAGASVWWDRELIAGDDFDRSIERELTAAECVIVLWTETSIRSNYVRDEAQVAIDGAKLIPIASERVDPPLGFRRVHLLRVDSAGPESVEFTRLLRRAVEERIGRTLEAPAQTVDSAQSEAPSKLDSSHAATLIIPLGSRYRTIAMGIGCVWIGADDIIEVRAVPSGSLLARSKTSADVLRSSPDGESVICFGFAIGYHSPDSIRVDRWKLKRSIRETQVRVEEALSEPEDWHTSRAAVVESALRDAIGDSPLFCTYAWRPGPVDLSQDGEVIGVYVDDPDRRIQLWGADNANGPASAVALTDHHPVDFAILPGGDEFAMLERRGQTKIPYLSLWRIADGKCLAEHDLEYMNANSLCRTLIPGQVALGLDQSLAVMNVQNGAVEARIEIESRPLRKVRFDPKAQRIGIVTDRQLVAIDAATMQVSQEVAHGGSEGVDCDLRRDHMAALVTPAEGDRDNTALVIWDMSVRS